MNSKMEAVEVTVKVEESRLADYQKIAEDFGVLQISISKPLKFEELGLAAIDDGQYQCLACSKTFKGKEGCNWGHGLSAAIKLGTPEPGFFHFGPRLKWILQNLCLASDQKIVGTKFPNDQKINLVS